jgi:hypothetical protein
MAQRSWTIPSVGRNRAPAYQPSTGSRGSLCLDCLLGRVECVIERLELVLTSLEPARNGLGNPKTTELKALNAFKRAARNYLEPAQSGTERMQQRNEDRNVRREDDPKPGIRTP